MHVFMYVYIHVFVHIYSRMLTLKIINKDFLGVVLFFVFSLENDFVEKQIWVWEDGSEGK